MIEPEHPKLSTARQCRLLGLPRSSYYHRPRAKPAEDLALMRVIDEVFLAQPVFGSRQMTRWLRRQGYAVNRKRVRRLMRLMGLEALYPKPNLSRPRAGQQVYPYLLRDLSVERPNQVWATDITYVPIVGGFIYLCAVIDWHSRAVLAWELSNSLDAGFCVRAVQRALARHGTPEIFNTDQGCQFTAEAFTQPLLTRGVKLSMDGKGRCLDNIFVERLWRTLKYEEVYLHAYDTVSAATAGIDRYLTLYNTRRPHSSLADQTPDEAYFTPRSLSHAA